MHISGDGIDASSPSDLLCYLPAYHVLICKPCRYAIQPSAIDRHFKEIHRLLSKARKPFTEYARSLTLDDPAKVVYPTQDEFPIEHLPVEQGWRCEAPRCTYMCVSEKRMEMHWSAVHRCKGAPARDWSAVPLQTFFRGNMVRYFAGPRILPHDRSLPVSTTKVAQPSSGCVAASPKQALIERYRLHGVDLDALDYYFSATYNTFLIYDSAIRIDQIWRVIVPTLALQYRFLLEGILSSGCLHLGYSRPERFEELRNRSIANLDSALPAYRHALEHPTTENCDAIVAFAYLLLVVSISGDTESSLTDPLLLIRGTDCSSGDLMLPQWVHFLRFGCTMLWDVWPNIHEGPLRSLIVDLQADVIPETLVWPQLGKLYDIVPTDGTWSEREIEVYKAAAYGLAESFAQIDLAAVDGQARAFHMLASWPIKIQDEALLLLSRRHPGMLILMAYYCICLKKLDGFWYFKNRAATLMVAIEHMLEPRWHPCIEQPRAIVLEGKESQTKSATELTNLHPASDAFGSSVLL